MYALYACQRIKKGDELTWHYGSGYATIREIVGYSAGRRCTAKPSIPPHELVLRIYKERSRHPNVLWEHREPITQDGEEERDSD